MILIHPAKLSPQRRHDDYDPFWFFLQEEISHNIDCAVISAIIADIEEPARVSHFVQLCVRDALDS